MGDLRAREFSEEERRELAEKGHALPDGSYPIVTREDLENAIQAIGRAKDPDAAKRHIEKRAKDLGLTELIPEEWNKVTYEFRDRLRRPLAREKTGRTDWYRIQNKAGEPAALYIYDEIGYFGHTAKGLASDLAELDTDELDVHLNSPGGDIFDGLAIYQALKDHRAKVVVRVDGLAASIASVIAMAGDKIVMAPKASIMIHDGWTMAVGNAADMRKAADLLDKQSDVIASVYADRAGQTAEFWRDRMREENWYNAREALDAGLVDEVEGQEKKTDDAFDLSVFNYAGRGKAPEPVLEAEPAAPEVTPETETPKAEFQWDFAAFKSAFTGRSEHE